MSDFFNFTSSFLNKVCDVEKQCESIFKKIDLIQEYNQQKVLSAFIKNRVTASDFSGSTGYGYGDKGRDKLDKVFSDVFGSEDGLVRHTFVCGTHAIAVALFAVLRPGDKLLVITGRPYDTLSDVIGLDNKNKNQGSLKDFGVKYDQIELNRDGLLDLKKIEDNVKDKTVVHIQRSRGYELRPSLNISQIKEVINIIKNVNKDAIILVDNCYGEFVDKIEPSDIGADLVVGSLIKNPGGGIAKTGGYIVGRKDLIEKCAARLNAPGIGREVGCSLNELRNMFLGLFFSPQTTSNALKTAVFASKLFEDLGYEVSPRFNEERSDIIQAIKLGSEEKIKAFCEGLQKCSPVDSFVSPIPWDMPGYDNKVIMAAGAFTLGSSIELSADAPMREPFAVWLQGGLTYFSGKIGIMSAAKEVMKIK